MITYNGVDFSTLDWIIITDIDKPLTGEFSNSITTLTGIDKAYDYGFNLKPKAFEIKGVIYANQGVDIYELFNEFLEIVYTKDLKEFYINANPSKVYKGRLYDSPSLNKVNKNVYEVIFTIICPDPYAVSSYTYHKERISQVLDTFTVNNKSIVDCYPIFKVRNATVFDLDNYVSNGGFEKLREGWTYTNNEGATGAFSIYTSISHSGDLCGCVTKPNQYTEKLSTKLVPSHIAGHTYYGSVWINCEEEAGVEVSVIETVINGGTSTQAIIANEFSSLVTGSWQKVEFDFTPISSESLITVEFNFNSSATYTTYIDDLFITDRPQVSVDYFGIKVNDTQLSFSGALLDNDTIVLDCEKWTAKIGDTNMLPYIDGGFPALKPGENEIKITTNNEASVKVILEYKERYL